MDNDYYKSDFALSKSSVMILQPGLRDSDEKGYDKLVKYMEDKKRVSVSTPSHLHH